MTARPDKRRPLLAAILTVAAIGAALVAPVMIGARRGEPIPGSTVRAASGESVSIAAPLTLFAQPSITLERGTVTLVGPAAGESRVSAALRALVLGGGAEIVLDRAVLVIDRTDQPVPDHPVADRPAANEPEAKAAGGAAPERELLGSLASALSSLKFRSVALIDSTVVVKTVQGSEETFSNVGLEITLDRHGLLNAAGRVEYRGEPLDVAVAFTAPTDKPEAVLQARVKVKGNYIEASFHGRMAPGERAQITAENAEISISDLRSAARWLGVTWPSGPGLGQFSAKGQLAVDDRSISFEHAEFSLDGNVAAGALAATLKADRPSIEGTLAFTTFDVAPYMAPSRSYALALASDWLSDIKRPGSAAPQLLRELNADIRISAANVVNGSERLGKCAASLSVVGGKLYGEIAELELDQGGTGEGQFNVDMTGTDPRYTLRADFSGIDLETLASPQFGATAVDGAGDIHLDLNAAGSSEMEVMRSLAGTVSVTIAEGGRIGLDLEALPRVASAPPGQGWGAAAEGDTTVREFAARFTAANGVLTAADVKGTTADRAIDITGTIDVDKSAVDLLLSIANGKDAAEPGKPVGVFRVHGPWSAPAISASEQDKAARSTVPGLDPG